MVFTYNPFLYISPVTFINRFLIHTGSTTTYPYKNTRHRDKKLDFQQAQNFIFFDETLVKNIVYHSHSSATDDYESEQKLHYRSILQNLSNFFSLTFPKTNFNSLAQIHTKTTFELPKQIHKMSQT